MFKRLRELAGGKVKVMSVKSDIEIAREAKMKPIVEGEPRGMFAGTDIDRRAGKCGRHDQGELPNDHPKAS